MKCANIKKVISLVEPSPVEIKGKKQQIMYQSVSEKEALEEVN